MKPISQTQPEYHVRGQYDTECLFYEYKCYIHTSRRSPVTDNQRSSPSSSPRFEATSRLVALSIIVFNLCNSRAIICRLSNQFMTSSASSRLSGGFTPPANPMGTNTRSLCFFPVSLFRKSSTSRESALKRWCCMKTIQ